MSEEIKCPFARSDGFNPASKCDNPYQEKWIHKQVVKKTGDSEDDFILEEKAVMIDKVNIQKSIDEEAKVTDLKYLLAQLVLQNGKDYVVTGEEPELNSRPGFYGDITGVQELVEKGETFVTPEQIKATLPEELQTLSTAQLAEMSDEDILKYIAEVRASKEKASVEPSESAEKEG